MLMAQRRTGQHFVGSIERATERNAAFRRVVTTGRHLQLVSMSLGPGEEIGLEAHPRTDQFIRIESGRAIVMLEGQRFDLRAGDAVLIPAGTQHNVIATGRRPLKLYTLYAPPEHAPGTVER